MKINISTHFEKICIAFLFIVFFLLNVLGIKHLSLTYDEKMHYSYGLRLGELNPERSEKYFDSKMPFSFLNVAIPRGIAKLLQASKIKIGFTDTFHKDVLYEVETGRYVTILFSLVLAVYVFKWSKELYGAMPGIFSTLLYVFSPNIIAHSRLVTTDLYAALMVTISSFYFWKFIKFGGYKRAIFAAFILGLSQLAKYSCIFLYPIFFVIILVRYSNSMFNLIKGKNTRGLIRYAGIFLKYTLLFTAISILVINIGFLFYKSFTPLAKYEFRSNLFKTIQSVPILKSVPIPLPYPYLQGLDMVKFNEQTGATYGNIYLLGKLRETNGESFEGFKGYFFYAFLFKEPIATQLIIFLSIIIFIVKRKKYNLAERDEIFLLLPVLFFIVYFNFFFKAQIGLRFLLVIFPLIYIFCGSLLANRNKYVIKFKSILVVLAIYLIISVLSYHPHYLSYFNEIIGDRKKAYKYLADSNIDWGQNQWYLNEYLKKHPETIVNPGFSTLIRIIISVNKLVGVFSPERYKWLRENFEPVDHIAYSYLVYEISPEDLEKCFINTK